MSGTGMAMARGLGWFSLALGAAEVLAPRLIARSLGLRGAEPLVVGCGAREIATGAGILLSRDPTPWIWGRVAGDALDLTLLAAANPRHRREETARRVAAAAVAGVTSLDLVCARALRSEARRHAAAGRRRGRGPSLAAYGARSGFPGGLAAARGAARDFEVPRGFRTPAALRPLGMMESVAGGA